MGNIEIKQRSRRTDDARIPEEDTHVPGSPFQILNALTYLLYLVWWHVFIHGGFNETCKPILKQQCLYLWNKNAVSKGVFVCVFALEIFFTILFSLSFIFFKANFFYVGMNVIICVCSCIPSAGCGSQYVKKMDYSPKDSNRTRGTGSCIVSFEK